VGKEKGEVGAEGDEYLHVHYGTMEIALELGHSIQYSVIYH
jgi:hypothetical protein